MGTQTKFRHFTDADTQLFRARVAEQYRLLAAAPVPAFTGHTNGGELEVPLINATTGQPMFIGPQIIADLAAATGPVKVKPEAVTDQVEVETAVLPSDFALLEQVLEDALRAIRDAAGRYGGLALPVGTLPTLRRLGLDHLSDSPRYHVLDAALHHEYGRRIRLPKGAAPSSNSTACIGATTSLQIHHTAPQDQFASYFNAAQLTACIGLGPSTNSPLPFGESGWAESRIDLLERLTGYRAGFGNQWLTSYLDAFRRNLGLPILIPECTDDPETNPFEETDLLNSTTWDWNRVIRHVARIETRYLPAGFTAVDMAANTRFVVGLMHLYASQMDRFLVRGLSFTQTKRNFYNVARRGLDAQVDWPTLTQNGLREDTMSVRDVILSLLEPAAEALAASGSDPTDADRHLQVIHDRVVSRRDGTWWQRNALSILLRKHNGNRDQALAELSLTAAALAATGEPVHTWDLPA